MNKFNYALTASEDNALVDLIAFVEDMGLPEGIDHAAYESLSNKILDNIWFRVLGSRSCFRSRGGYAPPLLKTDDSPSLQSVTIAI